MPKLSLVNCRELSESLCHNLSHISSSQFETAKFCDSLHWRLSKFINKEHCFSFFVCCSTQKRRFVWQFVRNVYYLNLIMMIRPNLNKLSSKFASIESAFSIEPARTMRNFLDLGKHQRAVFCFCWSAACETVAFGCRRLGATAVS